MSSSSSNKSDIYAFLTSLDPNLLISIYNDVYTVLTVFRGLSVLAKHYILRFISTGTSNIRIATLDACVLKQHSSLHREAILKLRDLRIIYEIAGQQTRIPINDDGQCFTMNDDFRNSMIRIINGTVPIEPPKIIKHLPKLNKECQKRWEKLVHYLIGSDVHGPVKKTTKNLVQNVGLMKNDKMTSAGFQFLYQPLHKQIWKIIIGYMRTCEQRSMKPGEVLTFLFQLGFKEVGQKMEKANLTPTQKVLVQELQWMGLIYTKDDSNRFFFPSHLILYLAPGKSFTKKEEKDKGYIIVETTFYVYAYTNMVSQIGLLKEFCRLDYKFPNLVRGKITKAKIMAVLERGITVDRILSFLQDYAHPVMRENNPILPVNVSDQIKLWGEERERLIFTKVKFIKGFSTRQEYNEYVHVLKKQDEKNVEVELQCPETTTDVINLLDNQESTESMTDRMKTEELCPLIRKMIRCAPGFRTKYELILQQYSWQGFGFLRSLDKEARDEIQRRLIALHTKKKRGRETFLVWNHDEKQLLCTTERGFNGMKKYKKQKLEKTKKKMKGMRRQ